MKLGETKTIFAWFPIHRLVRADDGSFYKYDGWYWLRWVVVMQTFCGRIAFSNLNE